MLRLTCTLPDLAPSSLISYCRETHLDAWEKQEIVVEPWRALHVDDLMTGGRDYTQAKEGREKAVKITKSATFEIHQWNSNVEH